MDKFLFKAYIWVIRAESRLPELASASVGDILLSRVILAGSKPIGAVAIVFVQKF
jgi:hypothetical protein